MNPMQVAQNRTARLVQEHTTPVYSTDTERAAYKRRQETLRKAENDACKADYCFVCSRATDHWGEHSDDQLLAYARRAGIR